MPIYEYQCPDCGHIFEEWVNITSATNEAPCPQCGQQAVHIISNTAFVLKGGGWYATDYGSRKNDGHTEGQGSDTTGNAGSSAVTSSDAKGGDAKSSDAATTSASSSASPAAAAPAEPAASASSTATPAASPAVRA